MWRSNYNEVHRSSHPPFSGWQPMVGELAVHLMHPVQSSSHCRAAAEQMHVPDQIFYRNTPFTREENN